MWIDTCEAQRTEIQGLNERLNNSDRVILCDEVIKPLGKQGALISVGTLDKTLHDHLARELQDKYIRHHVFTRPVTGTDITRVGNSAQLSGRLKRVFGIDIETCPTCGRAMRIIACIEDPEVIEKILAHLDAKVAEPEATRQPPCRAPPQRGLFDDTG
jgi:hypothetical protein